MGFRIEFDGVNAIYSNKNNGKIFMVGMRKNAFFSFLLFTVLSFRLLDIFTAFTQILLPLNHACYETV